MDNQPNSEPSFNLDKTIEELQKEVGSDKSNELLETLQLPQHVLDQLNIPIPDLPIPLDPRDIEEPKKPDPTIPTKRKRNRKPLMESDILDAQKHCETAFECAYYLGVKYKIYKKWAKIYGIFKINPWRKGSKKNHCTDRGKYPLNRILKGEFPDYPIYRLRDLLIRSGKKPLGCEKCGFSARRKTDKKMPLILNFLDGNPKNHLEENIKLYCYNCTFLYGRGYTKRKKLELLFNDPDRVQDSLRNIAARY